MPCTGIVKLQVIVNELYKYTVESISNAISIPKTFTGFRNVRFKRRKHQQLAANE